MGIASLIIGIFSIVLGVVPLLPLGGPALLTLTAVGLPLGILGLGLGLASRSGALRRKRDLSVSTAGLSASVAGTLICAAWIGGIYYMQRRIHQAAESCRRDPARCLRSLGDGPEERPRPAPPPTAPIPATDGGAGRAGTIL